MVDMSERKDAPLGYLLNRVAGALRADLTTNILEPLGLTFPQFVCLRMLEKFPGMSNAEIAREIGVSPQAMNIVVRALQDRGLVARPSTVASGRSRPVELTRDGHALVGSTDHDVRAVEDALLSGLSTAQRQEFRRILTDLAGLG